MRIYAYDIIYGTLEGGGHSDTLFHTIIKKEKITEHKGFLKRLSYGTIERAIELDAYLSQVSKIPVNRMDASVRTILRMALYELRYMKQVPEAVTCHEAVELARDKAGEKSTSFVNGVLRSYLRKKDMLKIKTDWQRFSLPKELMDAMQSWYGKKTAAKIGESFLEQSGKITVHVNEVKMDVESYKDQLENKGISYENGFYHKEALILNGAEDVTSLPGYEEGYFYVQDESSMLPVLCADIKKDDVIADICSAPGGKTLHALIKLAGTGMVSARDVSEKKVKKIQENIRRMGFNNVEAKIFDATETDPEWKEKADIILADVPCSGIGIIGRKPEIKYHAMEQMDELVKLQRKICESSVQMLKPGGVFMYSTCTINPEENAVNVKWLQEHLSLVPESLDTWLPENLRNRMTAQGMLQVLPGINKSDGFFVARLRKNRG